MRHKPHWDERESDEVQLETHPGSSKRDPGEVCRGDGGSHEQRKMWRGGRRVRQCRSPGAHLTWVMEFKGRLWKESGKATLEDRMPERFIKLRKTLSHRLKNSFH